MSDRETKIITTQSGVEIVLNTYMTGGELMDLEAAVAQASVGIKGNGKLAPTMSMDAGDAYTKRLKMLAAAVIVSIGGETDKEKIWQALRSLRSNDYSVVMAEVENCAAGLSEDDAKK